MRTIADIKATMTTTFMQNESVQSKYGLLSTDKFDDKFSTVSLENILFYIAAAAIFAIEVLLYEHLKTVKTIIEQERVHTVSWYRNMVLDFKLGCAFDLDTMTWNTDSLTDSEIKNSEIIKQCAVIEDYYTNADGDRVFGIIIKIAGQNSNGVLNPVSEAAFKSVKSYINNFKDAGINVKVLNNLPDLFGALICLYVDPNIIYNDSCLEPVKAAIKNYFRTLSFNGAMTINALENAICAVEGVDSANAPGYDSATKANSLAYDFWINNSGLYQDIATYRDEIVGMIIPKNGYFMVAFSAAELDGLTVETHEKMLIRFAVYDKNSPQALLF